MARKKASRIVRTNTAKPVVVGTCKHCGADVYDGKPVVCCTRGLLGYLAAIIEHAAELATRR